MEFHNLQLNGKYSNHSAVKCEINGGDSMRWNGMDQFLHHKF
jgi:hypothetical protein